MLKLVFIIITIIDQTNKMIRLSLNNKISIDSSIVGNFYNCCIYYDTIKLNTEDGP